MEVDINRRLYAPNAFSPNDDGDNDYFFLQCPDVAALQFLKVFDRWGNLVFETDPAGARKPSKNRSIDRIDPLAALIMACGLAARDQGPKIYQGSGISWI